MQHDEPGREPTEPTDAELLRDCAAARIAEFKATDPESHMKAIDAKFDAENARDARGSEYLSGQRPMPEIQNRPPLTDLDLSAIRRMVLAVKMWNDPGCGETDVYHLQNKYADLPAGIIERLAPMPDTPAPDEQDATLVKLIDLLTRTANAVKGQPGEMKQHGWADLPELCTALTARVAELEAALSAIQQYGSDTLSGRADGPDDRKWQRDAVLEMTKRARVALSAPGKEPTSE